MLVDRTNVVEVPLSDGNGRKSSNFSYASSESDETGSVYSDDMMGVNGGEDKGIDSFETKQGLNTWRLAALTFFTVSGGPYGLEPLVGAGGPMYAVVGLLIVPWVWGLPTALMTAELASALPEMGGYIVWVQRTMGDFWAFQNGLWNVFSNALDNSLYPVMFVDYLEELSGHEFTYMSRTIIGIIMVTVLGLVNVIGVDIVGDGAGVFGIFVILPFIVLVIWGFMGGKVDFDDLTSPPPQDFNMGMYLSILFWNTCGYDSAGTCAAEVENPGKIYPRAMLITIFVTTALYIFPIMVGVSYATDYSLWDDGYFVIVAEAIGNVPLKLFVLIAGCVSALGLLNSTMCTSSRALACVAGYGYLPKRLSRISPKYGTPVYAIFFNTIGISLMVLSGLDFESIAQLSMWLYGLTLLFEFFALIILRVREPGLERPYKIPTGIIGVCLLSIPPCACAIFLMVASEARTWYICGGLVALTLVLLIPYYYFSGKPVTLPFPFSCLFTCCGLYSFKKLETRKQSHIGPEYEMRNGHRRLSIDEGVTEDTAVVDLNLNLART